MNPNKILESDTGATSKLVGGSARRGGVRRLEESGSSHHSSNQCHAHETSGLRSSGIYLCEWIPSSLPVQPICRTTVALRCTTKFSTTSNIFIRRLDMSHIKAKIHRIETMVAEVQKEIEITKNSTPSQSKQQRSPTLPKQPELDAALKSIERICTRMEKIRNSIAAAKSQTQIHPQPRHPRTALLRPKFSAPQQTLSYQREMELESTESPTPGLRSDSSSLSDLNTDDLFHETRASSVTSRPSSPPLLHSETTQLLRVEQMGSKLVDSLKAFMDGPSFSPKITIEDLFEVEWANINFDDAHDHEQCAVKYQPTSIVPGCATLKKSKATKFRRPCLPTSIQFPSEDEAMNFLEQTVRNPPKKILQYYVGPRLTTVFSNLLHPGPVLSGISLIEGVNSVYDHIGEKWSGTAFHREDAHFRSCNLTLSGVKGWILIRQYHSEKFENYIRTFAADACDQFVRHQSLLFAPSELRDQSIDFDIYFTKPGDLIITAPGQYHAVINFTDSYAISTNFLLPDEAHLPLELRVCSDCGLSNLYDEGRLKYAETLSEIQKCTNEILEDDPLCSIPAFDRCNPPSAKVFKLAAVIRGRAVVSQFFKIVEASRKQGSFRVFEESSKPEDRVSQHVHNLARSENKSDLLEVRRRYDQILLVKDIERSKQGQIRANSAFLTKICDEVNWTAGTLRWNRDRGQAFKAISEVFDGLIYFIPTKITSISVKATTKEYVEMANNKTDLEHFKTLLQDDYTRQLCAAGKAFQQSHTGSILPRYRWEGESIQHVLSLSAEELSSYITPLDETG